MIMMPPVQLCCRVDGSCFLGFHSFLSAFLFSIETQNTIGEDRLHCLDIH